MDVVQRNKATAIPIAVLFVITLTSLWYFDKLNPLSMAIAGILLFPAFGLIYLVASYVGPKQSKLYGLEYLTSKLPAVKKAKGHVEFKYKLMWTGLVVILYFVLTNVYIYGLNRTQTLDVFQSFREQKAC